MRVRLGHSADPDDAFMAWPLDAGLVDTGGLEIELVPGDIQELNEWALEGRLEAGAVSMHAYARVRDRYVLLPVGASFGVGYGPVVVARRPLAPDELRTVEIVVPGALTTAYLVLREALGAFPHRSLPFDRILGEVVEGRAEAGLVIHEGQLTYGDHGLVKCLDLGEWWQREQGLPLPLGVVVARRDLGGAAIATLTRVFREAIELALARRSEALAYALRFGRGLDPALADRFVAMYVNELTLDMGDDGRRAVDEVLRLVG